jgi:hypothetical protein
MCKSEYCKKGWIYLYPDKIWVPCPECNLRKEKPMNGQMIPVYGTTQKWVSGVKKKQKVVVKDWTV